MERSQRIFDWIETFLLVIEILDTVLLVIFREEKADEGGVRGKSQGE